MRPKTTTDTSGGTPPMKRGPGRPPLKRRRTSSVASGSKNEDDEDSIQEPSKKRKKLDPSETVHQLYELIRNHKKEDGSLLCDAFIRVPKRRQEPGYYEVVSNPIDLLKIQQKLKTDEYEDVEELQNDVELLINNAKAFYKRNSQEHKDACELWEFFLATKQKLLEDPKSLTSDETPEKGKIILKVGKLAAEVTVKEEPDYQPVEKKRRGPGRPPKEEKKGWEEEAKRAAERAAEREAEEDSWSQEDELGACEDLFTAVMTATDDTNRPLHLVFQLLPSKKRYPKYYEVIDNPIDLRMIARKIQDSKYTNLNEMEKDLLQMTRNACTFNEPGSQIYKDAKALRKIIQSKKIEIEHSKLSSGKTSERISKRKDTVSRAKRLRGGQSLSAITAALKDDDDDSDEELVHVTEEDAENPKWQLYLAVKSASNAQGQELSEPFWKLPSKRYYPDYYKEIKNPLSLMQIGKKLKRGDYGTVSEVAGDMNIMFENAKKYNRADSRLYKDAVKLQKLMQAKVQELLELDHQYSDSEDDSGGDEPPPKTVVTSRGSTRCLTRGKYLDNIPLKRRLYSLCKCLIDYTCEDGRQPMLMFMEKPSKKLYPDYYKVIDHPIDMLTIESNIKAEKYQCEEEILSDFKLMFDNCKRYNEEGSMIYDDAIKLQKILMGRVKELGPLPDTPGSSAKKSAPRTLTPKPRKITPNPGHYGKDYAKMRTFFNTIKDYKDPKNNRQLSVIFNKLPSKIEYPDYYEVIKKPTNMESIAQKLKVGSYENLDDLVADFVLMFDNACKYNEPDSQIYKDALMLQRVALQTKLQLKANEDAVPDVTAAVQELLTSLFTAVYNHQDEEGRCFSDSMQELPEHDEVDGKKLRALSLDLIKRRLDGGQYRRLDQFQEDLFSCMERARKLSRTDSQVFEDSVELQSYFIRQRDELCLNGDLLHSPALNYTLLDLSAAVDLTRQQKLLQEQPEEEEQTRSSEDNTSRDGSSHGGLAVGVADNALSFNQQVYRIGDFVYAEPKERGMDPILLNIQRLWTNQEGQQMLYGNQYYRPRETYHVTTRKFLEKEVFKTDQHVAIPLNQVLGRCCVLSVKDYFRSRPDNFEEKDVYVCESRYSSKARAFKKIKNWPQSLTAGYKLLPRDEVLEPKRVMSVFRERVEKHKEEIAELEEREKLVEKEKPNVVLQTDEAVTYFEQFNTNGFVLKTGDCVYVKTDTDARAISQIDSIWTNAEGEAYFHGPWLVLPSAIPHTPARTFYKQEVFLSTLEDTNSVNNIVGKCAVLEHGEYISCRPTEIPESDVYVCESQYDEARRSIKELPREGLKKYTHSAAVTQDEIYFFRRLINPQKVGAKEAEQESKSNQYLQNFDQNSCSASSPATNIKLEDIMCEDSMDGGPPSVGSFHTGENSNASTPVTSKKKRDQKKLVTGYILYSGDVRKGIAADNPACSFGEVSRMVGNEWRNLPTSEKIAWEEKAARVNEETAAKMAAEEAAPASPATTVANQNQHPDLVYECCWDNCDWQFEDMQDCIEHAVAEGCGHVHMYFAAVPPHELEFQCQWRGCTRMRKAIAPFPSLHRLARHVKEVHIMKSQGRVVHPDHRSKNFMPSSRPPPPPPTTTASSSISETAAAMAPGLFYSRNTPSPASQNGGGSIGGRNNEPLFVTVPPRPSRLLHSEAYIKYIEGLHSGSRSISNWDKQLKAAQETTDAPELAQLPAHWLGNGVGNHGNILTALWTLRDFMFRDALGISKLV
ncbi:protein polybromo-1-like isoform X2 [Macrosteles quadrilineatus]|uniref:protein polybromo-1-like isoform X2 n=1 Tax=Macrosteles quadrilineatus TaxID=74068 RepID=UPI0023E229B0|nr:protein polybromo-1-like isoform X2 [Macrosteles quadrilineatus]